MERKYMAKGRPIKPAQSRAPSTVSIKLFFDFMDGV
jgi:hypothetical protein